MPAVALHDVAGMPMPPDSLAAQRGDGDVALLHLGVRSTSLVQAHRRRRGQLRPTQGALVGSWRVQHGRRQVMPVDTTPPVRCRCGPRRGARYGVSVMMRCGFTRSELLARNRSSTAPMLVSVAVVDEAVRRSHPAQEPSPMRVGVRVDPGRNRLGVQSVERRIALGVIDLCHSFLSKPPKIAQQRRNRGTNVSRRSRPAPYSGSTTTRRLALRMASTSTRSFKGGTGCGVGRGSTVSHRTAPFRRASSECVGDGARNLTRFR